MKVFLEKPVTTSDNEVGKRFKIGRNDDGRIKIVFEQQNALGPHNWYHVAGVVLDDEDTFGYLDAAGVRV
jgi:hypothetical protein